MPGSHLVGCRLCNRPGQNIADTLKDQATSVSGVAGQVAFRKVLVTAQISLSSLLLIGAGLFIRSLANLRAR